MKREALAGLFLAISVPAAKAAAADLQLDVYTAPAEGTLVALVKLSLAGNGIIVYVMELVLGIFSGAEITKVNVTELTLVGTV